MVMLVHREEYYLSPADRQALRDQGDPNNVLGEAEIIVAKQRNGPIGYFLLTFVGRFTKFENWVPEAYGDEAYP